MPDERTYVEDTLYANYCNLKRKYDAMVAKIILMKKCYPDDAAIQFQLDQILQEGVGR
jgi:hypothetical protein